jgi:hypothetical protein
MEDQANNHDECLALDIYSLIVGLERVEGRSRQLISIMRKIEYVRATFSALYSNASMYNQSAIPAMEKRANDDLNTILSLADLTRKQLENN